VLPYARRTIQLIASLRHLARALGGAAGARLGAGLALPSSRAILLRLLRQLVLPAQPTPRILGVDDWAHRKVRPMARSCVI
jgi:transposase